MSREIKFRAWDNGEMVFFGLEGGGDWHEMSGHPIMQYTGLHDRNGRKIWEEDIVLSNGRKFVVEYEDSGFEPFTHGPGPGEDVRPSDCEVIGNIHEHGELLDSPLDAKEKE